MGKIVDINEELCVGCGECVLLCPRKILFIEEGQGKCRVIDESRCDKLAGCERVCPVQAIRIRRS